VEKSTGQHAQSAVRRRWRKRNRSRRCWRAEGCRRREPTLDTLQHERLTLQFFRLFETSLGVSPKIYLNVVRMERALDAVMREDTPLGELSERFGFPEPAHFTRFFRDHAGVSPREFRNVSRLAG